MFQLAWPEEVRDKAVVLYREADREGWETLLAFMGFSSSSPKTFPHTSTLLVPENHRISQVGRIKKSCRLTARSVCCALVIYVFATGQYHFLFSAYIHTLIITAIPHLSQLLKGSVLHVPQVAGLKESSQLWDVSAPAPATASLF